MKKAFTGVAILTFLIYIFALYSLLLARGYKGYFWGGMPLAEYIKRFSNFIPFKTIISYISGFFDRSMSRSVAVQNLAGNVLILMPMGFYLPFFIRKMAKLNIYALTVAALIIIIEVTQMLTRSGIIDVDDFILNMTGALIGFWICAHTPIRNLFKFRAY